MHGHLNGKISPDIVTYYGCKNQPTFYTTLFTVYLTPKHTEGIKTVSEAYHNKIEQMNVSIAKNFCILHNEVEHNYISSSITLRLQLHVSALCVGHLQVVT